MGTIRKIFVGSTFFFIPMAATAAFADGMVLYPVEVPLLVLLWPLFFLLKSYGFALLLGWIVLFVFFRKKRKGYWGSAWRAYLCVPVLLFFIWALLSATGDITPRRGSSAASRTINHLRSLKSAALISLIDGNELPLGSFASDSRVVSDCLASYMDRSLDRTMIVISIDLPGSAYGVRFADPSTPLFHLVARSSDVLPLSPDCFYLGFEKHPLMAPPPGFFTRLWLICTKKKPKYRIRDQLAEFAKHSGLFKNTKGELYDGGDTILMKVF